MSLDASCMINTEIVLSAMSILFWIQNIKYVSVNLNIVLMSVRL